jgi:hypothetical protein
MEASNRTPACVADVTIRILDLRDAERKMSAF